MKLGSRLEVGQLSHPGDNLPGREDRENRIARSAAGNGKPPFGLPIS